MGKHRQDTSERISGNTDGEEEIALQSRDPLIICQHMLQ